jgi:predicted amidohydrolase YtcJ
MLPPPVRCGFTGGRFLLFTARPPADLVLANGKIRTVDDKRPEIEAVAILGNRIAPAVSTEELRKWAGVNTKVADLKDKRVTPGFNDSHAHFLDGGMRVASVQLRDARIPENSRGRIRQRADGFCSPSISLLDCAGRISDHLRNPYQF